MSVSKGNATEARVLWAMVSRNVPVYLPFGDGQPSDLVIEPCPGTLLRVQCKTARAKDGCLVFNSRATDHGRGQRAYHGLADVFATCHPQTGSVYVVPVAEVSSFCVVLRLRPPANNQRRGIRFAADYALDRWTDQALAALAPAGSPSVGRHLTAA